MNRCVLVGERCVHTDRPDHAFNIAVLPRRPRSDRMIADADRSDATPKHTAENLVVVSNKNYWRGIPWKRLRDLARQPFGSRMLGDRDANDLASKMPQNDESIETFERDRRRGQKID